MVMQNTKMRLNWLGFKYIQVDGYGRLGLHFIKALLRAGHDVMPHVVSDLDMPAWFQRAQHIDFNNVTVQLMPPHNMRHLPGRSVGFSMHESMTLPDGWADHVNTKAQWL